MTDTELDYFIFLPSLLIGKGADPRTMLKLASSDSFKLDGRPEGLLAALRSTPRQKLVEGAGAAGAGYGVGSGGRGLTVGAAECAEKEGLRMASLLHPLLGESLGLLTPECKTRPGPGFSPWPPAVLSDAAEEGQLDIIELLLNEGVPPDSLDTDGWGAVHMAAAANKPESIKALLARGASVSLRTQTKDESTPLMVAARKGSLDAMRALLAAGARVDEQDKDGWQPLHEAANAGQVEAANFLLSAGGGDRPALPAAPAQLCATRQACRHACLHLGGPASSAAALPEHTLFCSPQATEAGPRQGCH